MSKCKHCGYERPDDATRARVFAEALNRENPMRYPLADALELGRDFAARPGQNCGACGKTFEVAAPSELEQRVAALEQRVVKVEADITPSAPAPVG